MFNNSISDNNRSLSQDLSTYLLHKEALNRFEQMNAALANANKTVPPGLLDYRFQILDRVVKEEEQNAERLLQEAFARK